MAKISHFIGFIKSVATELQKIEKSWNFMTIQTLFLYKY